eukprot:Clim_evm7s38 gene=Clim_evmTU7s38
MYITVSPNCHIQIFKDRADLEFGSDQAAEPQVPYLSSTHDEIAMKFITTVTGIVAMVQATAAAGTAADIRSKGNVTPLDATLSESSVTEKQVKCRFWVEEAECVRTDCFEDCPELLWGFYVTLSSEHFIPSADYLYDTEEGEETKECHAYPFREPRGPGIENLEYVEDGFEVGYCLWGRTEDLSIMNFVIDHVDHHVVPPITVKDIGKKVYWNDFVSSDEESEWPMDCTVQLGGECYYHNK